MGYTTGQRRLAVRQHRTGWGHPAGQIFYRLATSHVALPQTDHELTERPPQAAQEETHEHPNGPAKRLAANFSQVMSALP